MIPPLLLAITHQPGSWQPASYDEEDDVYFTYKSEWVEGILKIETVNLSPLCTAHERFEDRPELFDVIFNAQRNFLNM